MSVHLTDLEIGNLYAFDYNGKPRLAVALDTHPSGAVTCWDFRAENYRNFDPRYASNIRDVTQFMKTKQFAT